NNNNSFWHDIKRMNKSRAKYPTSMDGHAGKEAIGNHMAQKYERLYNSVSYNNGEMTMIKEEINTLISSRCNCTTATCRSLHGTTVADIKDAVGLLNWNKNDGLTGLSTNHLKRGTDRLFILISVLVTGILQHGYIPQEMLKSTIVPIPKNLKKSLSDSSNYRAIALNSPMCKLLEAVILNKCSDTLSSSDMQFGYKKGLSTSSCTYVVNEVVQYYKNGGSSVYAMLLDASQAFDRVVYTKLLKILLEKGLCPTIARTIAFLYIHQQMRIRWIDFHSDFFIVTNGVKQGGILSPALFSVYIDVLLLRLKRSGFGCYIGDNFVGAFSYADDIIILCPTKFSLRIQLNVATVFSHEYQIIFNPTKCQLLFYRPDNTVVQVEVVFQDIVRSQPTAVHLGHLIGPGGQDYDFQRIISDFNRRVNVLISKFYFCWLETKVKLFHTYCMSLYGSVLWDLSDRNVNLFYTAWRKAIRKFLGLHPMTHSVLLQLIIDSWSPDLVIEKRLLQFLCKVNRSKNNYVNLCSKLTCRGSRSSVSNSLSHLVFKHRVPRLLDYTGDYILRVELPQEGHLRSAGLIRDLIRLRDSGESRETVNALIALAGVG
ncbi:MAG: reverse transcriptase family protein, partial [Candidatus Omnitrophica bacterium]|nr:reverse transcriptase family protein [Candidatus Omnitrophota bacterium]